MNEELQSIIAIPARLESSRLPNKIIADIEGIPMIQRVLERCKKVKNCSNFFLCTDSKQIAEIGAKSNIKTIITSQEITSGSERIASVLEEIIRIVCNKKSQSGEIKIGKEILKKFLIVNVQGDQPFINVNVIEKMINIFYQNKGDNQVITPIYKLNKESIFNPNIVKLVLNHKKQVMYFSRSPIPHVRGIQDEKWYENTKFWGHVGIYGYRADILYDWDIFRKSDLENLECLEQLRLIQEGIKFDTFEVEGDFLSVDTLSQLEEARKIAKENS